MSFFSLLHTEVVSFFNIPLVNAWVRVLEKKRKWTFRVRIPFFFSFI